MTVERMTGIVQILLNTLHTLPACAATQARLHHFLVTLQLGAVRWKSVSAALLIILWSTVQVRDALPFIPANCSLRRSCIALRPSIGAIPEKVSWPLMAKNPEKYSFSLPEILSLYVFSWSYQETNLGFMRVAARSFDVNFATP
jgi:hypothetical protein